MIFLGVGAKYSLNISKTSSTSCGFALSCIIKWPCIKSWLWSKVINVSSRNFLIFRSVFPFSKLPLATLFFIHSKPLFTNNNLIFLTTTYTGEKYHTHYLSKVVVRIEYKYTRQWQPCILVIRIVKNQKLTVHAKLFFSYITLNFLYFDEWERFKLCTSNHYLQKWLNHWRVFWRFLTVRVPLKKLWFKQTRQGYRSQDKKYLWIVAKSHKQESTMHTHIFSSFI